VTLIRPDNVRVPMKTNKSTLVVDLMVDYVAAYPAAGGLQSQLDSMRFVIAPGRQLDRQQTIGYYMDQHPDSDITVLFTMRGGGPGVKKQHLKTAPKKRSVKDDAGDEGAEDEDEEVAKHSSKDECIQVMRDEISTAIVLLRAHKCDDQYIQKLLAEAGLFKVVIDARRQCFRVCIRRLWFRFREGFAHRVAMFVRDAGMHSVAGCRKGCGLTPPRVCHPRGAQGLAQGL
jgi:hypothetical protein